MANHSPEPWTVVQGCIEDANGSPILKDDGDQEQAKIWIEDPDLDRIVACVNACDGISSEELWLLENVIGKHRASKRLLEERREWQRTLDDKSLT